MFELWHFGLYGVNYNTIVKFGLSNKQKLENCESLGIFFFYS